RHAFALPQVCRRSDLWRETRWRVPNFWAVRAGLAPTARRSPRDSLSPMEFDSSLRARFAKREVGSCFHRACVRELEEPSRAPAEIALAAYCEVLRESANELIIRR